MSDYGTPPPPPPLDPSGSSMATFEGGTASALGELASWPQRVGGYLIDVLITLPGIIIYQIGAPSLTSTSTDDGNLGLMAIGLVIILAIDFWNRWLNGGKGQTLGKKVVGLKLINEADGQPVGTGKAFLRDLAHILDSIICGLPVGWLWPLWDKKRQTWADKIVKTVVIQVAK